MELLKLLSTSEIVAQIVSFLLLFFLLRALAWKRILGLLDERKAKIISELKSIEDTKTDIGHLKSKYDALLLAIEETAHQRIKEAISAGEKSAQQIREDARLEAQKIIETAKENLKYEVSKSRGELKNQIVELVIRVTEDVLTEKLTSRDDKRLVEDFIRDMDKLA